MEGLAISIVEMVLADCTRNLRGRIAIAMFETP
jgi:hypothetical protein